MLLKSNNRDAALVGYQKKNCQNKTMCAELCTSMLLDCVAFLKA